jgi:hypothetical protein
MNSALILNKPRFLARYGLDDLSQLGGGATTNLQITIVNALNAARYMKFPVIFANVLTIVFEIFFGG